MVDFRRVLTVVGLAFAVLPAGSALAATTIGQTGPPLTTVLNGAFVERAEVGSVIPGAGRVTSFQFQAGSCVDARGSFDFQVLRPLGGSQYQVIGHTGVQVNPCDGKLHSYRANIRVKAGDVLGVYVAAPWEGVLDVAAPEDIAVAVAAPPMVNDVLKLRSILDNTMSTDESATFVPSQNGNSQGQNNNDQGQNDNN